MVCCSHCGNSIHSERNHQGDPRYRERHGWPCTSKGASVIARRIDGQIGTILSGIELAPQWRERILSIATTSQEGLDLAALKKMRIRLARAYGDGGYTEEEYLRRLAEIDAKMRAAVPVTLPSTEEAAALLDDFPALWEEALPQERHQLVAPLVERVYLDLKTKMIAGIRPRPGFGQLLGHAISWTQEPVELLLSQDEVQSLQNVGMVETGERWTQRSRLFGSGSAEMECYSGEVGLVKCLAF
jgi:hypothetical protein